MAPSRVLKTRQGTIAVGVGAVLLAVLLLVVYLSHYRNSVKQSNVSTPVLVATRFFPKGTPAAALAKRNLFTATAIAKDDLQPGAITDASVLRGQVAAADVYPGQQLKTTDFAAEAPATTLSAQLRGPWRAIAIAPDGVHGLSPQVQTGDTVDVYVQIGDTMGLLKNDVLVLQAPKQTAANTTAPTSDNYILRVTTKQAPRFAYAAENGKVWFVLRPAAKSSRTPSESVSGGTIFVGPLSGG